MAADMAVNGGLVRDERVPEKHRVPLSALLSWRSYREHRLNRIA